MFHEEEQEQEEGGAWEIALADLMTTLMVFFLVMWLISMMDPKGRADFVSAVKGDGDNIGNNLIIEDKISNPKQQEIAIIKKEDNLNKENIEKVIKENVKNKKDFDVEKIKKGLKITLYSDASFDSGKAYLNEEGEDIVNALSEELLKNKDYENLKIKIVGHTDDIPIHTFQFPSNWELSSARSASIARLMEENGISGEKLTIVGKSKYLPKLESKTKYAKKINRRIEIFLETK